MQSRKIRLPDISLIEYEGMQFLIMDSPKSSTLSNFVQTCEYHKVTDVVRVCECHYDQAEFISKGIQVHNLEFTDGSAPPPEIIEKWLDLLKKRFLDPELTSKQPVIRPVAVHCLAGLGRAPVLVAIALMELGMTSQDAISLIRDKRRGAFNQSQLGYLTRYHSKNRLKKKRFLFCCSLM